MHGTSADDYEVRANDDAGGFADLPFPGEEVNPLAWLHEEDAVLSDILTFIGDSEVDQAHLQAVVSQLMQVMGAKQKELDHWASVRDAEITLVADRYKAKLTKLGEQYAQLEAMVINMASDIKYPGKSKSIKLAHGKVGYRTVKDDHKVLDEAAATSALIEMAPEAVKLTIEGDARTLGASLGRATTDLLAMAKKSTVYITALKHFLDDTENTVVEVPGVHKADGTTVDAYFAVPE